MLRFYVCTRNMPATFFPTPYMTTSKTLDDIDYVVPDGDGFRQHVAEPETSEGKLESESTSEDPLSVEEIRGPKLQNWIEEMPQTD